MTEHEFARLIEQPDSEALDYKQAWYDRIAEGHVAVVTR